MGRDNQPKHRQVARSLKRRESKRQTYERILIVCEGQKTEPNYLRDIQQHYRLSTTHVQVLHSAHGTEPQQVLEHALSVFNKGDRDRGIFPRAFDRIVVVFDRDEHKTYHLTLDQAEQVSGRLKNDDGEAVTIEPVTSVPCFELWLLLHFEDVRASLTRQQAIARAGAGLKPCGATGVRTHGERWLETLYRDAPSCGAAGASEGLSHPGRCDAVFWLEPTSSPINPHSPRATTHPQTPAVSPAHGRPVPALAQRPRSPRARPRGRRECPRGGR